MAVVAPPQVQTAFHYLSFCQGTEFCEEGRALTQQEEAVKATALDAIQKFIIGEHAFGWPMQEATLKEMEGQAAQQGGMQFVEMAVQCEECECEEDDEPGKNPASV